MKTLEQYESEVIDILERYKLRIPPTVYYELKADIVNIDLKEGIINATKGMTREEAIAHIKDIICENNTIKPKIVVFEQEKEALNMAIKALEQEPRWIPVTERLPEEDGYYITTTLYHEVYCDCWHGYRFNRLEAVIAWMPLPQPYKAESEEE